MGTPCRCMMLSGVSSTGSNALKKAATPPANPFGQLGWKPAQSRMCRSVLIGCPLSAAIVTGQHLLAAQSKVCRKLSPRTSRLQQMNVQAYLALEPMKTAFATGSSAMRLCKYKKISYMYSYMNYNYNTQI